MGTPAAVPALPAFSVKFYVSIRLVWRLKVNVRATKVCFPRLLLALCLSFALVFSGVGVSASKGKFCGFECQKAYAVVPAAALVPAFITMAAALGISVPAIMAAKNISADDVASAIEAAGGNLKAALELMVNGVFSFGEQNVALFDEAVNAVRGLSDDVFSVSQFDANLIFAIDGVRILDGSTYGFTISEERYNFASLMFNTARLNGIDVDWAKDWLIYDSQYCYLYLDSDRIAEFRQSSTGVYGNGYFYDSAGSRISYAIRANSIRAVSVNTSTSSFDSNVIRLNGTTSLYNPTVLPSAGFTFVTYGHVPSNLGYINEASTALNDSYSSSTPFEAGNSAAAHTYYQANPLVTTPATVDSVQAKVDAGEAVTFDDVANPTAPDAPSLDLSGILGFLQKILQAIMNLPAAIAGLLLGGLGAVISNAIGTLDWQFPTAQDIGEVVGNALSGIGELLNSIWQALASGVLGALDSILELLRSMVSAISSAISTAIEASPLGAILEAVQELVKTFNPTNTNINSSVWSNFNQYLIFPLTIPADLLTYFGNFVHGGSAPKLTFKVATPEWVSSKSYSNSSLGLTVVSSGGTSTVTFDATPLQPLANVLKIMLSLLWVYGMFNLTMRVVKLKDSAVVGGSY